MGLLDNLYFGHNSSFGGQGGGLLDFLRTTQMQNQQYQPSAGFGPNPNEANASMPAAPMNIGGYQMPRIGTEQQFTPDPAALPQNAQPVQGQMPMQPPQQPPMQPPEPSGGFGAGLQGFLQNLHTGPLGAIAGGIGSAAGMQSPEVKQANQTAQFLVSKGMDPAMAKTVVSDPTLLRSVLPSIMGTGGQTDDIKEYQFAKKEDPSLTFQKFMQQKKAVSGEYSLTPQYGTNEKGETVLIQPGKSGEAIQTKLPPGVKISSGVEKIDLGTTWGIIDKRTGQMVGQQAKDIEGKESAEERGKAKGLAQVSLPNVINKADQALKVIDDMLAHPGRETATGLSGTLDPRSYIPGTNSKDFQIRSKQLQGKAFLEAFESLKGGGAISEREGEAATAAIARLDLAQSDEEYVAALKELRGIVSRGVEIARQKAGQSGQSAAVPQPNAALKAKYGLD